MACLRGGEALREGSGAASALDILRSCGTTSCGTSRVPLGARCVVWHCDVQPPRQDLVQTVEVPYSRPISTSWLENASIQCICTCVCAGKASPCSQDRHLNACMRGKRRHVRPTGERVEEALDWFQAESTGLGRSLHAAAAKQQQQQQQHFHRRRLLRNRGLCVRDQRGMAILNRV
eukprot:364683-Chlamydomonas_euryale.AAC.5